MLQSLTHAARRVSLLPGAMYASTILSRWAPSLYSSMQETTIAPQIRERLTAWRRPGARLREPAEGVQVGRRAGELAGCARRLE